MSAVHKSLEVIEGMTDALKSAADLIEAAANRNHEGEQLVRSLALEVVGLIETLTGIEGAGVDYVIANIATDVDSPFNRQAIVVEDANRFLGGI